MESILDLTSQLGKAISESNQAAALRTARAAIETESDLVTTMKAYQEQMEKLQKAEQEGGTIEVADKHTLEELHNTLVSSDIFKAFNAAQMEYIDLMRRVNTTLRNHLADTEAGQ